MSISIEKLNDITNAVNECLDDPYYDNTKNHEADVINVSIMPFLHALGYNANSTKDVQREWTCDALGSNEHADVVVFVENQPKIIIEAKDWKHKLDYKNQKSYSQLFKYFSAAQSAFLLIFTNGVDYYFFIENSPNYLSKEPLYYVDIRNVTSDDLKFLNLITKKSISKSDDKELKKVELYYKTIDVVNKIERELPQKYVNLVWDMLKNELDYNIVGHKKSSYLTLTRDILHNVFTNRNSSLESVANEDIVLSDNVIELDSKNNNFAPRNDFIRQFRQGSIKVGKLTQNLVNDLIEKELLCTDEVEALKSLEISKQRVSDKLYYPLFSSHEIRDQSGHLRTYRKPLKINGVEVHLNSQLYEQDGECIIKWYLTHFK